ncbi:MAG: hypothetical protein R3D51_17080 [Hyphomicrobiaceae bacterium]
MLSFDENTADELKRILRQSDCAEPVLMLYETAEPTSAFDELERLYSAGVDQKTMEQIGQKIYEENSAHLIPRLAISACERSRCRPEDIVVISGLAFVMASYIQEALDDCWIIADQGAFFLKDSECIFPDLMSALTKYFKK